MEAIVKRLVLKKFRSFPNDTVEFDNPTFVLGRNGAGKSNFVDAFSFLSDAMSSPLQAAFDRRGGISAVRNRSSAQSHPPNLGIRVDFGTSVNGLKGGYFAFEVKALPTHGFAVVQEQCEVKLADGKRFWFNRGREFQSNADGVKPSLEPAALSLPLIGGDARFAPVLKLLSNMRVYSIEPAKLREMQDPDSGTTLKRDGGNAASVLQDIARNATGTLTLKRASELLAAIVPNTKSFRPKKHGNKLSLEFTQEWAAKKKLNFEAFSMSDGTLRALGLLMAVYQTSVPSVLVIEEPEATIHPGAFGAILDLIQEASQRMQVVVTTHSPELLDASWIEDKHLRIAVWNKGASYILPPSDATRQAMREHLMGAGELLRSNALDPAPLFEEHLHTGTLFEDLR